MRQGFAALVPARIQRHKRQSNAAINSTHGTQQPFDRHRIGFDAKKLIQFSVACVQGPRLLSLAGQGQLAQARVRSGYDISGHRNHPQKSPLGAKPHTFTTAWIIPA